ncbi:aldehyde dehydrogenase family protein [Actinomycetospora flava]|uniref:Aldehyde dehydrogenase family protein n=1 Tax=Actinomycetospora flava TaxID=3129232 RepID=A0ABU8M8D2_9PSEU
MADRRTTSNVTDAAVGPGLPRIGVWVAAAMAIATTNPATGEAVREFDTLTEAQLEEKLQRSWEAFGTYRDTTFEQRAGWLRRAADIFDEDNGRLAQLATLEMGKTLVAARVEVTKCADGCRWYADHAAESWQVNAKTIWVQ